MIKHRLSKYSMPEPNTGCILWCGAAKENGYGVLNVEGATKYAHRLAWEQVNGPIPQGQSVCHKCDVTYCINPDHMFLGTQAENMADKVAKGRQHRGERVPHAKFTAADIRAIRASDETHVALARKYGVAFQTIAKIRSGATWAHVQEAA